MYFVCDACDSLEYGKIMDYKRLYELLVREIVEDTIGNSHDEFIVKTNVDILGGLAKNNFMNEKDLINNLQGYGWEVVSLTDIIGRLEYVKQIYKALPNSNLESLDKFDEVIKMIKEIK